MVGFVFFFSRIVLLGFSIVSQNYHLENEQKEKSFYLMACGCCGKLNEKIGVLVWNINFHFLLLLILT